jgi:hypothetical protein
MANEAPHKCQPVFRGHSIGAGLCGISEFAKNKLLGYPSPIVGGLGVIVLLLTTLMPSS